MCILKDGHNLNIWYQQYKVNLSFPANMASLIRWAEIMQCRLGLTVYHRHVFLHFLQRLQRSHLKSRESRLFKEMHSTVCVVHYIERGVWQRNRHSVNLPSIVTPHPIPCLFLSVTSIFSCQTVFTCPLTSSRSGPVFLSALHLFLSLDVFSCLSSLRGEPGTHRVQVERNNVGLFDWGILFDCHLKEAVSLLPLSDRVQSCLIRPGLCVTFQTKALKGFIDQK